MLIIAQVLKENGSKITVFARSQTANKLVTEAANGSPRVSGQDRKKNCWLSELIRLHDLEDSTLSQA